MGRASFAGALESLDIARDRVERLVTLGLCLADDGPHDVTPESFLRCAQEAYEMLRIVADDINHSLVQKAVP